MTGQDDILEEMHRCFDQLLSIREKSNERAVKLIEFLLGLGTLVVAVIAISAGETGWITLDDLVGFVGGNWYFLAGVASMVVALLLTFLSYMPPKGYAIDHLELVNMRGGEDGMAKKRLIKYYSNVIATNRAVNKKQRVLLHSSILSIVLGIAFLLYSFVRSVGAAVPPETGLPVGLSVVIVGASLYVFYRFGSLVRSGDYVIPFLQDRKDPEGRDKFRLWAADCKFVGKTGCIKNEENPTIPLTPGKAHELTIENRDGDIHALVLETESGKHWKSSGDVRKIGNTASVKFEVPRKDDSGTGRQRKYNYYCYYHPKAGGELVVSE